MEDIYDEDDEASLLDVCEFCKSHAKDIFLNILLLISLLLSVFSAEYNELYPECSRALRVCGLDSKTTCVEPPELLRQVEQVCYYVSIGILVLFLIELTFTCLHENLPSATASSGNGTVASRFIRNCLFGLDFLCVISAISTALYMFPNRVPQLWFVLFWGRGWRLIVLGMVWSKAARVRIGSRHSQDIIEYSAMRSI